MFGFLNINKPVKMTSHDVISYLRKITKIKQIGHAGTLDPFAQGVLPVAIGKATRLIEYISDEKEYLAEVSFGKTTDTYDCDGNIISESNIKVTEDEIICNLQHFRGEIEQIPPVYSAIKVKGKKLYEYAREGKEVDIASRKVFIEKIELKNYDYEKQVAQILVKCSKGTYIRSIAYDLGNLLGCGAYLSGLLRTQSGLFRVENSVNLENLLSIDDVEKNLLEPPVNLIKLDLNELESDKISVGQNIQNKRNFKNDEKLMLIYKGKIKAIAKVMQDEIKAEKVFNI